MSKLVSIQIPWHLGFSGAEHEFEGSAVTTISSGYLHIPSVIADNKNRVNSTLQISLLAIGYILENTVYSQKYSVEGLSAFNEWVFIENLECNVLWDRF